ncbi:MAG: hypothetical protein GY708_27075 [Actinomycetia bacterium]|nr:hypothetical protein [Actinomycetes bacterium]MCP4962669.1 hypothetical protein [Actinomycetes bacterium]
MSTPVANEGQSSHPISFDEFAEFAEDGGYEVTLVDRSVEMVAGADAYSQEGPLTTFFDTGGRDVIDSWAVRTLSVRTADIAVVRRFGSRRTAAPMPSVVTGAHLTIAYEPPNESALAS